VLGVLVPLAGIARGDELLNIVTKSRPMVCAVDQLERLLDPEVSSHRLVMTMCEDFPFDTVVVRYKDQALVEDRTIVKSEVVVGLLVEALEQGVCCLVLEV